MSIKLGTGQYGKIGGRYRFKIAPLENNESNLKGQHFDMKELTRCNIKVSGYRGMYISQGARLNIVKYGNRYLVKGDQLTGINNDITTTISSLLDNYPYESLYAYLAGGNGTELTIKICTDHFPEYILEGKEITKSDFVSKFNLNGKPNDVVDNLINEMLNRGVLKRIQYYSEENKMLTRDDIIKKYNLSGQTDEFIDIFIKGFSNTSANTIMSNNVAIKNKGNINSKSTINTEITKDASNDMHQPSIHKNDYITKHNENKIKDISSDPIVLLNRGVEEKRKGNYNEAIQLYKKSEQIDCTSHILYLSMGKTYYILGQYEKAISSYMKSLHLLGEADINILMHLGHALLDSSLRSNTHAALVEEYRSSIDPYFDQKGVKKHHIKLSINDIENYDNQCINEAYRYLSSELKKQSINTGRVTSSKSYAKNKSVSEEDVDLISERNTYHYDCDGYYDEDGGKYDRYGYDRDDLDEYGYDEDRNGAYD